MEKRTIEISLETAKEWYNSDNESLKQVALQAFKKEELKEINYNNICKNFVDKENTCYTQLGVHTSKKQLDKLIAINKLMNVAKYLNGDWKPDWNNINENKYSIRIFGTSFEISFYQSYNIGLPYFKTKELAEQAIEILGEDTIRLALSTDW